MIRRHPQRPSRRPYQDFHFFAASDPTANIESQFARPLQAIQPPAPAPIPEPAPEIQVADPAKTAVPAAAAKPIVPAAPNAADVMRRATEYLAKIKDPRELIGKPRPPFMDDIEALAATRPSAPAKVAKKPARAKTRTNESRTSPKRRNPSAANQIEAADGRSHHERHCKICTHRDRADIEADFIEWRAPDNILRDYNLSRAALYRHVRAVGLYARRNANLRYGLGRLIECVDHIEPTADSIVRAIHAFARINDQGQWVELPAHVIVSSGGIRRQAAAPGANRPIAISLDSPALPGMIDISRPPVLPETAERVETDATR